MSEIIAPYNGKFTTPAAVRVRSLLMAGASISKLARLNGCTNQTIRNIRDGNTYPEVPDDAEPGHRYFTERDAARMRDLLEDSVPGLEICGMAP